LLKVNLYLGILFILILVSAISQLLLKKGVNNKAIFFKLKLSFLITLFKTYFNIYVLAGSLLYLIGSIFWIIVISQLELSFAYPLISINFIFIALLSKFIFKEKLTKNRLISLCIITLGVIFITLS